jgi:outer membrane receptor protein involved in Fe transport
VLLVVTAAAVVAQETTGSLAGTVKNDLGEAIAGASVTAIGPLGQVSTDTGSEGVFRFLKLSPGDYVVIAEFEGFQPVTTTLTVALGETMTVNFTMQSTFSDEITVFSDTVSIDFKESATTTSIRELEIDYLPRGRDFTDVVSFAAGVVENNQAGGISVDGASGLENRYVIDGLDTTDPEIGSSSVPMRAEMMEEVQIKSAGYAAEYGGSLGGVVNAVTRSGGNELHGSVFVDFESYDWNGSARPQLERGEGLVTYKKDDRKRYDPGFVLGGPIMKDRWWFFISYQPGIRTTDRTIYWDVLEGDEDAIANLGPDLSDTYTSDYRVDYTSANTTLNLNSSVMLKAGINLSPYETDGLLPNRNGKSGLYDQENYAPLGVEGERETYYINADWIPRDDLVVSARAGFYHTNSTDTGVPLFDLIHNYSIYGQPGFVDRHPEIPSQYQTYLGWQSDNFQRGVNQWNIYERTAWSLDGTWYLDTESIGEHAIKLGYQTEEIFNDVQSGDNATRILYYWDTSHTTAAGESVTGNYGVFRLLNIYTSGKARTNNQAVFLQDSWTVLPNLTVNVGIRSENESVPNYGYSGPDPAISFGWGDKLAPRIGFSWDIKGDAKWKLYGSYGKYFDVTKYEMPRGSFGGEKWVDFWFTFDNVDISLNDVATCAVGNNTIFDVPVCPAGTLFEVSDRRINSADPANWEMLGYPQIDPNIKPMESWEAQIGLEYQLTSASQLGARFVHKEIVRTIEDVGLLYPGVGEVYIIANPGEGVSAGYELPYVKPVREYDALELTYDKRFRDNWSLRAYYTLSRLWGNYTGLANADETNSFGDPLSPTTTGARLSPNVSRLWDVAGSAYDENGNPVYGKLPTDRTHQLGAQMLYVFDWGFNIGVNQYIGSGSPISTMGRIPQGNSFYPYGRGDLGKTPWLTQTDLTLFYNFKIKGDVGFSAGLTILNLWDEDTPLRMWTNRTTQDLTVTEDAFLTGFSYAAEEAELGTNALDTEYGLWDTFQLPRELRLTFKIEF